MKCANCGANLGPFKKYVSLVDGGICYKCFKSLGFDPNDKDDFANATCREVQAGYNHYANKQKKKILEDLGLPTFNLAHYGEEREVDATDEEKQMFYLLQDMLKARGYDPDQLDLVRKSDNYVAAAIGSSDLARFKFSDRAAWVVFPSAEVGAVKHYIGSVSDLEQFNELFDTQISCMKKHTEIKK